MSYILDALRKSERERNPGGTRAFTQDAGNPIMHLPGNLWPYAWVGLAVLGLIVAGIVYWPGRSVLPPVNEDAVPVSEDIRKPSETANIPAPTVSRGANDTPVESARGSPVTRLPVYDLAEQARTAAVARKRAANIEQTPVSIYDADAGRDSLNKLIVPAGVPWLREKSDAFQRSLPSMRVTIHVYSPAETQRILFINNREYRKGDEVQDGVRIMDIVEDGAILSYRGEMFKLSRPN